jgi:hypothetical protein
MLPDDGRIAIIITYIYGSFEVHVLRFSIRAVLVGAILASAVGLSSCAGGYQDTQRFMGVDRISPKAKWTARGDLSNPQVAVDGRRGAAATASGRQASLMIDLGRDCLFNYVVIDHGSNERGYASQVAILTSTDEQNWRRQAQVPGLRRITSTVLRKPVLARYVRLEARLQPNRPWSVAEIYLY